MGGAVYLIEVFLGMYKAHYHSRCCPVSSGLPSDSLMEIRIGTVIPEWKLKSWNLLSPHFRHSLFIWSPKISWMKSNLLLQSFKNWDQDIWNSWTGWKDWYHWHCQLLVQKLRSFSLLHKIYACFRAFVRSCWLWHHALQYRISVDKILHAFTQAHPHRQSTQHYLWIKTVSIDCISDFHLLFIFHLLLYHCWSSSSSKCVDFVDVGGVDLWISGRGSLKVGVVAKFSCTVCATITTILKFLDPPL